VFGFIKDDGAFGNRMLHQQPVGLVALAACIQAEPKFGDPAP